MSKKKNTDINTCINYFNSPCVITIMIVQNLGHINNNIINLLTVNHKWRDRTSSPVPY